MAKKRTFSVAITPDRGLEIAEMNHAQGTVVKYVQRSLEGITVKSIIPDMDVFKDILQECLTEIGAPKGSSIILTLPTITMGIGNYMASQTDSSIVQLITDDLIDKDLIFRDTDPIVCTTGLSVSIQSKIVAYTASIYAIVQEAAKIIVDIGYKIDAIDVSAASVYRALIHTKKVQPQQDTTWLMLLVDNSHARLLTLNGESLIEYKEEQVMYDFSDTAGNCDMVAQSITPYLEKIPANYLYVVSRTDSVSAEMLASKIQYNNPIIFLEANSFAKEGFIDAPDLPEDVANGITLELIGGCLYDESLIHFNMYNEDLGDVYTDQQPLQFKIGTNVIVLTIAKIIQVTVIIAAIIAGIAGAYYMQLTSAKAELQEQYDKIVSENSSYEKQIKELSKVVSTKDFDEVTQMRIGISSNTLIYNYFDLLGKEMPEKVWLSFLEMQTENDNPDSPVYANFEGQSDNIESIYRFYRNIKDTMIDSNVELQKLSLASKSPKLENIKKLPENGLGDVFHENSNDIMLSSNADFYEFIISNKTEEEIKAKKAPKKVSNTKKRK